MVGAAWRQARSVQETFRAYGLAHVRSFGTLEHVERDEFERSAHADETCPVIARFKRIFFASKVKIQVRCIAQHNVKSSIRQPVRCIFLSPAPYIVPDISYGYWLSRSAAAIAGRLIMR